MVKMKRGVFLFLIVCCIGILGFSITLTILQNGVTLVEEKIALQKGENWIELVTQPEPPMIFTSPHIQAVIKDNKMAMLMTPSATLTRIVYTSRAFDWKMYYMVELPGSLKGSITLYSPLDIEANVVVGAGEFGSFTGELRNSGLKYAATEMGVQRVPPVHVETARFYELGRLHLKNGWNTIVLLESEVAWKKKALFAPGGDTRDENLVAVAYCEKAPLDLPGGIVYIFDEGKFAGFALISNMAKNQKIEIEYGKMYDLIGSRTTVEDRYESKEYRVRTVSMEIRNLSSTPRLVEILERLPWDWKMVKTEKEYTVVDARTIKYRFEVKGNGEVRFRYTIRYRR